MLSIELSKKLQKPAPVVNIQTQSFRAVPERLVSSIFDERMGCAYCFTDEEKNFVLTNACIFYFIYGYWHNYSNKAIRCSFSHLDENSHVGILANNDVFLRLQLAKQDQLNRRAQGETTRKLYLLD